MDQGVDASTQTVPPVGEHLDQSGADPQGEPAGLLQWLLRIVWGG